MSPAIKGHDTPGHYVLLWTCVAYDSQSTFPPSHCPGRHKTGLRLSSEYSWKQDSSLKIMLPQAAQFLVNRAHHHSNRTWWCLGVCGGKRLNGCWEHKSSSFSVLSSLSALLYLQRVMLDTCVLVIRWRINSDESGAVAAAVTIIVSS